MKVLVTGGAGFVGSWVVRKLCEEGVPVVAYDLNPHSKRLADITDRIDLVQGDLLDLPMLIRTARSHGVTHIIHLAYMLGVPCQLNPVQGARVNTEAWLNILETARLLEVERVVYISSRTIYGDMDGEHGHPTYKPIPEDHRASPQSVYAAAKLFGEHLGLNYRTNYGLDVIVIRYGPQFGVGQGGLDPFRTYRALMSNPVIARNSYILAGLRIGGLYQQIIDNAMAGKPTSVPRGGEQKNDTTYVKDTALGVYLACFAQNLKDRVFNIGPGQGTTLREVEAAVREVFPEAQTEIGPGLDYADAPTQYGVLDISRARDQLGYQPRYSAIGLAVRDYVDWARRMGSLVDSS